jgi:hypothetical protein
MHSVMHVLQARMSEQAMAVDVHGALGVANRQKGDVHISGDTCLLEGGWPYAVDSVELKAQVALASISIRTLLLVLVFTI